MTATKTTPVKRDSDATATSTEAMAARMEDEGQGQSTAPSPAPTHATTPAGPGADGAEHASEVEDAAADQDIDTAGTEMDEER